MTCIGHKLEMGENSSTHMVGNGRALTISYENILDDLEKKSGDFQWISRQIKFAESYKQDRPEISPTDLKVLVYNSQNVADSIKKIQNEKSDEEIRSEIMVILKEIGFAYNLPVIRWLGYFVVKILRRSLAGLFVNVDRLSQIKIEMISSPVVFVPTHRSYGDFILMAFLCFSCNVNIPCVAAGMDFLSMKFMNQILRNSKAFFMRRKFANDPVYRTVFREYIKQLISFQNSPVEFFIEGTRSRTGKSLMPKFGLLTMLADAYFSGEVPDIKIIPINISYDRLLEEKLFAYELMGIPKPKESTLGLLKGLRKMDGNYGRVFITFGDTISIREYFKFEEDNRFFPNNFESHKIKELAYKIIAVQQGLQTYGIFNILALILNSNYLKTGEHRISLENAKKQCELFLILFEQFKALVIYEGKIDDAVNESVRVHNSLVKISRENYLCLNIGENLPSKTDGDLMEEEIAKFTHCLMLQLYVNPSLNIFMRAAIIVILLDSFYSPGEVSEDNILMHYKCVCTFLKHEFVLEFNSHEFLESVAQLKALNIVQETSSGLRVDRKSVWKEYFIEFVQPFLSSVLLLGIYLKNDHSHNSFQEMKKSMHSHMMALLREDVITHCYCASLEFVSNVINSFIDLGIISMDEKKNECSIDENTLEFSIKYLGNLKSKSLPLDLLNPLDHEFRAKL